MCSSSSSPSATALAFLSSHNSFALSISAFTLPPEVRSQVHNDEQLSAYPGFQKFGDLHLVLKVKPLFLVDFGETDIFQNERSNGPQWYRHQVKFFVLDGQQGHMSVESQ